MTKKQTVLALSRRRKHLEERTKNNPTLSYDLAELSSLDRVLEVFQVVADLGSWLSESDTHGCVFAASRHGLRCTLYRFGSNVPPCHGYGRSLEASMLDAMRQVAAPALPSN